MSEETNDQSLSNQSQGIGNKNVSGDDNAIASVNAMGNANINQSRIITIYNYHYQQQTVTTLTEDNTEDNLICPYQGLYHFSYENSEYFFGRDVFVEELYQYTETRNFIPVLGASGSGKSSVILAGLVPKLVQAGNWQFTHFRPGNDPFHALAQALVPLYEPDLDKTDGIAQARKLAGYFQDNTVPLSDVFSTIQRNHPHNRILLIADQFEELYTLCNDEKIRRQFLDTLLNTFKSFAEQSSLSTVLVGTMRADFLGNALSYRPLADVLQKGNIMLGPMNENELRDIIEKPAQKLGVSFESGLVERILDDVDKQPGNLPLLEFALTELWKERKGKQLTHNAYKNIGEVSGALTCYADDKFSKLNEQEKQQVRRIFVQLVRPGAGTEDTRRVATKAELNDSNWDLVKKLADSRLVVTSRTVITREITDNSQPQPDNIKEQETVEVVHEALIRNWGQLREWMATDREFRTWQERLRASMGYWQEKNRDNGLLLRGAALSQAEEQLKNRRDELSPDEREFIQKSQQYKQRKRQRNTGFLTASFVAISGVAAVAVWQWNNALMGELKAEINLLDTRLVSGEENLDVQLEVIKHEKRANGTIAQIQATNVLEKIVNWSGEKQINSLEGHEKDIFGIAFSPKGDLLATASGDKTVKLWKPDGTFVKTLEGHKDFVLNVAFSPKGDLLATASSDKTVKLWKPDGTLITTLKDHEGGVRGVAFHPLGNLIATASHDKTVKLWKPDGTLITTLTEHEGDVLSVAFSPKGDLLATASADYTVKLWKSDGTLITTLKGHENWVRGVTFSPKGDLLATASYDSTVKLWKPDGTLISTLKGHQSKVNSVAFSPKGDLLASASSDNTVKLWETDGTLIRILEGHEDSVLDVAFSPKGDMIASASSDKTVKLWKPDDTFIKTLKGHKEDVLSVAFSPKEDLLATASADNTVKLWKSDGTLVNTLEGHENWVRGVTFSPKGDLLATASRDKTVKLWKADGTLITTLRGHEDRVINVSFSQNGNLLATASVDKTVKLWKADGTLITTLTEHEDDVLDVAFSPKEDLLATASVDKTVKLWKSDGTLITTLRGHEEDVNSVAFSPDGKLIASADKTVKLWKADGTLVETFDEEHKGMVKDVAFSPDGKLIATASVDDTVKLWKVDGTLVSTFKGHEGDVWGVAFSPDGKLLASASRDNTVKLRRFNRDQLLDHACNWMSDYLKNNPNLEEKERNICGEVEPLATALFLQGEQSAAQGKIEEAVSKFKQAVKLDSNFSSLSAVSLVRIGKSFVQGDQIEEAIAVFNQAQNFDSDLEIQASDWNKLCWQGSVNKQAEKVMFACNKAVELAPDNGWIYNSRGVARALTGNFDGAVKDFETFVKLAGNEEEKAQRNGWIESLKKGENPFPEEMFEGRR
ncbi:WD-40 repeat protein [Lyngbya sp. PCC 8106]|uniref:nSTAND1 domain-containing NTPase n=1 Tax=Lyngbya sp. (strain PCC 8106) TaxID=313612 RepID=UPI0000EA9EF6|nr:WD-40 repeat protein [Lyngbya sp. PCC 8106]EAW38985.1 WD-40 repeat protein [Lyngbya sp. PCC 8106]